MVDEVAIGLRVANVGDVTAIAALNTVILRFRREGAAVTIKGPDQAGITLVARFAVHDKRDAADKLARHSQGDADEKDYCVR